MTADEIKSSITGWCNQTTGIQLVEDRSAGPGAGFVLGLRAGSVGSGTVPVDVALEDGADRVTVRSSVSSSASAQDIDALLAARPATVRASTSPSVSGNSTVVTAYAYLDGFSKHVFASTVDEVAKTRALLDALTATSGAGAGGYTPSAAAQSPEPVYTGAGQPQPWAAASAQPQAWSAGSLPSQQPASALPAPSFGSPAAAGYGPLSGQPAPQAQPATAAFAPTHTVPPQGMQAWAAPDPNGAIVATLGGGLPIQVTEVRGAWAHVLCSNGWTGWVDGRIIGVAR